MWSPNHLKRNQIDSDDDRKQIFMEKRQRAFRKRRKKNGSVSKPTDKFDGTGNVSNTKLISVPGISNTRLTMKLGNLSNGVQGTVPAVRRIQQKIDMELAQQNVDLNHIKGPPTYRNLPKPALSEVKRGQAGNSLYPEITNRETVYQQYNKMLGMKICEAWPHLMYERELQTTLNKQMERFNARTSARSTPQSRDTEVRHGSGESSTNLSKPFSSWSINEGEDSGSNAFNQSFCRTIKRTFYRERKDGKQRVVNKVDSEKDSGDSSLNGEDGNVKLENLVLNISDTELDVSASALSLFETKYDTEDSGRGSTDFLDTITDTNHAEENGGLSGHSSNQAFRHLSDQATSRHGNQVTSHSSNQATSDSGENRKRGSLGYQCNGKLTSVSPSGNFEQHSYDPYQDISPLSSEKGHGLLVRGVKKDFVDVVDSMYNTNITDQTFFHQSIPQFDLTSYHVGLGKPYPLNVKPYPMGDRQLKHETKPRPIADRQSKHVIKAVNGPYYFPSKENREPNVMHLLPEMNRREAKSSGKTKKLRNKKFYVNKEWLH